MASSKKNEAKDALNKFKMEAASDFGVPVALKAPKPLINKAFRNSQKSTVGVPLY